MNEITLNRKQLGQLIRVFTQFKDVQHFQLKEHSNNGIGPVHTIHFNLFDESPTTVDITDVSSW
jgi:hypothetical protein